MPILDMHSCPHCHKRLVRVHRGMLHKLFYTDMYICSGCTRRVGLWRSTLIFLFSRHSRCIQCGSHAVHRVAKWDRVDRFTRNLLGLAQSLVGAPIFRCGGCRLQYLDWRHAREKISGW